MILYAATIFISAFLLFQVQPLIAKIILPWFGGTAAVWTICMLFFQVLLLAGYVYSHAYVRFGLRARRFIHIALLAAAAAMLPLAASAAWKPAGGGDPTWRILGVLATSVGLPYFVLSTTGPLVQAWYARSHPGAAPYRLFALSNLGSMLALVSYPLAVEPLLALGRQTAIWSAGFVLFALPCASFAWRGRDSEAQLAFHEQSDKPGPGLQALWAALAACASVLLLAFTGHVTLNIAAIPLLWVLPLALYLLSFVLCFEASGWYRRWLFLPLLGAGLAAVCATLTQSNPSIWTLIPLYSATLFAACMVCHGELARSKPDPRYLTGFYLMLALGGALGGVLVGLAAPTVFDDLYELPIGMFALCLLVGAALLRDRSSLLHGRRGAAARLVFLALTVALGVALVRTYAEICADSRVTARNFYGVLNVRDTGEGPEAMRVLSHGTIIHGKQFLEADRRGWPTSYYGRESGSPVRSSASSRTAGRRWKSRSATRACRSNASPARISMSSRSMPSRATPFRCTCSQRKRSAPTCAISGAAASSPCTSPTAISTWCPSCSRRRWRFRSSCARWKTKTTTRQECTGPTGCCFRRRRRLSKENC